MKKLFLIITIILTVAVLSSCQDNSKWEYKVIEVSGTSGYKGNYGGMEFSDPSSELNSLGEKGWEVVSTYTEVNTVHPNFGNEEYVTGLQPNTRTEVVYFVLKRRK
ncbi:MAG: DUF4177 domain-containing protein [Muribaculaceae bacterium]|nr:DUF4177 domain-containing protein [Muribaculaceae bacterium]